MRVETLKSPGVISSGLRLRTEAAKAISSAEIYLDSDGKQSLTDFFSDCAVKAGGTPVVSVPATSKVVANGDTVPLKNSAGTVQEAAAVVTIAANVVTGVALPATKTVVANGVKINAVSVTGTGNFATITVANGVITAIVLSAS